MRHSSLTLTFLTAACLVLAAAAPQEKESPDLAKRVKALERTVRAQGDVIKEQQASLRGLEERLLAVEAWFQALPRKTERLEKGLHRSREQGFVPAGANPLSKETLLSTLEAFGEDLAKGIPRVSPRPEEKGRGRRGH